MKGGSSLEKESVLDQIKKHGKYKAISLLLNFHIEIPTASKLHEGQPLTELENQHPKSHLKE